MEATGSNSEGKGLPIEERGGGQRGGGFQGDGDEAEERIKAAIKAAEANPPPPAEELVRDVYSFIPWNLEEEFGGEIMGGER